MAETWTWIVPGGGGNFTLTDFTIGMEILEGVTGRGLPPIRRTRVLAAGQPGSRLQDVEHDMRTLQLPILLRGADEFARQGLIDEFAGLFDPIRGVGTLQIDNAIGVSRLLNAMYAGGLELVEDASNRFPGCQAAVLTFEADDPYWYDTEEQTQSFGSTGTATPWFLDPSKSILPVSLSSSAILGTMTITVAGVVKTFPTWTIDGPGTDLVVRNDTTGREFRWGGTLGAGEQLIIDTRPPDKSVVSGAGVNLFGGLTAWDLWPLVPGDNDLIITLAGTNGDSQVTVAYTDRYLTA